MPDSWDEIVAAANVMVAKSADSLSQERAIEKFLKTDRGKQLYAKYRSEGDSLGDLAKEEIVARTATTARNWNVSKEQALAMVVERAPDLAAAAGIRKADIESSNSAVEKSAGSAWSKIEALADERVEKSDGTVDQAHAIKAVLETPQGVSLYSDYLAERSEA